MATELLCYEASSQHEAFSLAEKDALVNGNLIHYRIGGTGPPLLLLHGFTLTGNQWDPFVSELIQHYNVIIPDLPSHGGSDIPKRGFTYEGASKTMLEFLRLLKVNNVKAIGHSAGAITLLNMVVRDQNLIESMILVSGGHRLGKNGRKLLMEERFEDLDNDLQEFYLSIHPGGQKQLTAIFDAENKMAKEFPTTSDSAPLSTEVLSTITIPTFLIWGDRDIYFPIDVAVELYQSLPNAQLWVLPGQDHVPIWPEWGGDSDAAARFVSIAHQFFTMPKHTGDNALTN